MIDENRLQPILDNCGRGEDITTKRLAEKRKEEMNLAQLATHLLLAVAERRNWEELLVSFRSRLDHCDKDVFDSLPVNLPDILISMLHHYCNLSCTALVNVMAVIYDWFRHEHSTIVKFFVPEVIDSCCNILAADSHRNEQVLLLALLLIRFLCSCEQNDVLGFHHYVLQSRKDVVNKLIFLGSERNHNQALKREALSTIWTILRNKPNAALIGDFAQLFAKVVSKFDHELFDCLLATASTFIACGCGTQSVFEDVSDIQRLFEIFPRVSSVARSRILYLLMTVFEYGDIISEMIEVFNWNVLCECVSSQNDSEEVFNFLRLCSVAFATSEALVSTAYHAKVMDYLITMVRSENSFTHKRYAMLALLSAFQYGSLDVCRQLLSQRILDDIAGFLVGAPSSAVTFRIFVCMDKFAHILEANGIRYMSTEIRDIVEGELSGRVTEDMVPVTISESSAAELCEVLAEIQRVTAW